MTVPIGIVTYIFLPDTPYTTRAWFLTEEERTLAKERAIMAGKAAPVKVTPATFKRILSSWKWYAFVLGYVVCQNIYLSDSASSVIFSLPIYIFKQS